jgi:hypothetical protein
VTLFRTKTQAGIQAGIFPWIYSYLWQFWRSNIDPGDLYAQKIVELNFTAPEAGNSLITTAGIWGYYYALNLPAWTWITLDGQVIARNGGDRNSYYTFPAISKVIYVSAGNHTLQLWQKLPNTMYVEDPTISINMGVR